VPTPPTVTHEKRRPVASRSPIRYDRGHRLSVRPFYRMARVGDSLILDPFGCHCKESPKRGCDTHSAPIPNRAVARELSWCAHKFEPRLLVSPSSIDSVLIAFPSAVSAANGAKESGPDWMS